MLQVAEPFTELQASLLSRLGPDSFSAQREAGLESFCKQGLPTRRWESWKYTSVARLAETPFSLAEGPQVREQDLSRFDEIAELCTHRIVFVNGCFSAELSRLEGLPAGVQLSSLAAELQAPSEHVRRYLGRVASFEGRPFVALNSAFLADGAVLRIAPGTQLSEPLGLVFIAASGAQPLLSQPRNLIVVEEGAQAQVLECYLGGPQLSFSNVVSEVVLAANASLEHVKLQEEGTASVHLAEQQFELGRDCRLEAHSFALGGGLVRNSVLARLNDTGSHCGLHGLYLVRGKQHIDNYTAIDHRKPHCTSSQNYKGILDDQGVAVFDGKVFVRKDAQKTFAEQSNKNLLLSQQALVHTKPELQILADDVKCHHGATVGQLDPDALFYLRARGIPRVEARRLLTYAFASDIVSKTTLPALRERLEAQVFERLRNQDIEESS